MWKASRIVRVCLAGLFALAIFPAAQNFFVELARDYGAYDHPKERVEAAVSTFSAIVSDSRYWPTVTFLGGLLLGSLLDVFARWFDRRRTPQAQTLHSFNHVALDGMAEKCRALATEINILLGEYAARPPTHPKFQNSDTWWQENHERSEAAVRVFNTKYAADVSTLIDRAKRNELINDRELFLSSHVSSIFDIQSIAKTLSFIAGRVEDLKKRFS